MCAFEDGNECIGDDAEVTQGELCIIELSLLLRGIDRGLHKFANLIFILWVFGAGAGFGAIGKHEQRGLARTWARARVTELRQIHFGFVAAFSFNCLTILIVA